MPFFTFSLLCISDEPEIEVEAEKVHSGLGKEAHLTCIVHGEPRPTVSYFQIMSCSERKPPIFNTGKV